MTQIRATAKLTGFSPQFITARVPIILRQYDAVIFPAFKTEMSTAQFPWPRTTIRRNGQAVGSPRDIVDLGRLRASQQRFTLGAAGLSLGYRWGGPQAPYAPLVLNGSSGYVNGRGAITKDIPGRNWILPALNRHPLDVFFAQQWRRLSGATA